MTAHQNPDPFEERLKRQIPRRIPASWRGEILASLQSGRAGHWSASLAVEQENRQSRWSELFWPSPAAWGALACVWIVIVGMTMATPGSKLLMAGNSLSVDEIVQPMLQQRRLLARFEDLGNTEAISPPSQKKSQGPRSQRRSFVRWG